MTAFYPGEIDAEVESPDRDDGDFQAGLSEDDEPRKSAKSPKPPPRNRILFPSKYWTAFPNDVFDQVLGSLDQHRAGAVYLTLYDWAWHSREKLTWGSGVEIARRTGLARLTVAKCLDELQGKKLIVPNPARATPCMRCWKIPRAKLDLRTDGPWTPVPRFLLADYLKAYAGAILLPVLLQHQHRSWRNDCWPGPARLAKLTGRSKTAVFRDLEVMGNEENWAKLTSDLPRPLEIIPANPAAGRKSRHFRVRGLKYTIKPKGQTVLELEPEFADRFGVKS